MILFYIHVDDDADAVSVTHVNEDENFPASQPPSLNENNDSENLINRYLNTDRSKICYPPVCRNYEQFEAWQRSRKWLIFDSSVCSIKCSFCSKVRQLGLHTTSGQHTMLQGAFVEGTVNAKDAKVLLKKIDKHRDSATHQKCEKILKDKDEQQIQNAIRNAEERYIERHKENIEATAKVFRTAYECAKSHLPHTEHSRLIELQTLNGVDCGNILYSNNACSDIIAHIAAQMRAEIVQHIVCTNSKFSIAVDESTSVSNVQSMVVYLRILFEDDICTYFLGLLSLTDATAAGLEKVLVDFLHTIGLNDDILKTQFVGFCSDGASCMIGEHKGVATLLKAKFPLLQTFHCMAHRLELAVKNSVDDVNVVSHFKLFVDELYKVYSMFPKNQRELGCVAESLSIELLKIQKVFDVRWVFSSFVAVKAVLRDYPALVAHFDNCAKPEEGGRTSKERSKYKGLVTKLKSWFFVSETCLLKDTLRCLKQLSLYLQSHEADIFNAGSYVDDTINKLQALKLIEIPIFSKSDENNTDETENLEVSTESHSTVSKDKFTGKITTLGKFWMNVKDSGCFKDVKINTTKSDVENFEKLRGQFLQSLCDNLRRRFPSSDLLAAAASLNPLTCPLDPLERAFFGEKQVAFLCKKFKISNDQAADTVLEYAMFKKNSPPGDNLRHLISILKVLPVSSADCERGFSQMNLFHTSGRNRLTVKSVDDLLMIGINGSPLHAWNAKKYVITWLKSGRHGALDKATGLPKKTEAIPNSSKLFA